MPPRIETAEVLSYRLKLPVAELVRLPAALAGELPLAIEDDGGETVLAMTESDSYLRFRPVGADAVLTEIFVCNDLGGFFFERVLAALMVRYRGDLHARLVWSNPERNHQGAFAEIRIERGRATEPSLNAAAAALAAAEEGVAEPGPDERAARTALEAEVQESLARARAHWAEYQRLKTKKG